MGNKLASEASGASQPATASPTESVQETLLRWGREQQRHITTLQPTAQCQIYAQAEMPHMAAAQIPLRSQPEAGLPQSEPGFQRSLLSAGLLAAGENLSKACTANQDSHSRLEDQSGVRAAVPPAAGHKAYPEVEHSHSKLENQSGVRAAVTPAAGQRPHEVSSEAQHSESKPEKQSGFRAVVPPAAGQRPSQTWSNQVDRAQASAPFNLLKAQASDSRTVPESRTVKDRGRQPNQVMPQCAGVHKELTLIAEADTFPRVSFP
jgi:hypothetical protein